MAVVFKFTIKAENSDFQTVTTTAVDATGADFIAIWHTSSANTNTISDNVGGNTYTARTQIINSSGGRGRWLYAVAPNVSASMTFTADSMIASFPDLIVFGFSGVNATPFDNESTEQDGAANTSLNAGTISPTTDGVLLAGLVDYAGFSGVTIDNGFSTPEALYSTNGFPNAAAYKIQSGAAAVDPTFSWTGIATVAAIGEAFKEAVTAPPAIGNVGSLLAMFQ